VRHVELNVLFIAFVSVHFDDLIGMRTINVWPLVAFLATLLACSSRTDAQSASGAKAPASRPVRDSEIIRSAGVPTDPDDTAPTRYGKHETPRRIESPRCRPGGIALCLKDTAETRYSVDCCIADQRQTNWLVFAARDDSLQLFLTHAFQTYLTMSPPNAAGAGAETSLGVDAWWLRARFPASGTYVYTASIESDTNAPYELRVAPVVSTGASLPMGTSATLTLLGKRRSQIAVAPRALMPADDSAALRRFAVPPGRYRVLLVRDTLYEACRLPCRQRKTFTLRAGHSVAITP